MSRSAGGALVLCYHAVSDTWGDRLSVRPAVLERQLQLLRLRGFRGIDAAGAVAGRRRGVHVTFDDAYRSVEASLPALERLRVPATVFACSDYARDGRPLDVPELAGEVAAHPSELATMDWDALRSIAERGVEIGSHTVSHPRLTAIGDEELRRELVESRERVEDELRRPCRYVAYPYGDEDARVHAAARAAGYTAGFALPIRPALGNPFAVPRVGVYRRDTLPRFSLKTFALARRGAAALGRDAPPRESAARPL